MHTQKLFLFLFHVIAASAQDYSEPTLNSIEESAVYDVLAAINPEMEWKSSFPDNLCTGGPHGVVCDIDKEEGQWHIVELNLGWLSDYSNNPPCNTNASFTPSIAKFHRLRKLFFYNCFTTEQVKIPSYLWTLGSQLQELVFQDNPSLHGDLDSNLAKLAGLERLIVSGTSIGGAIPAEIGCLKRIQQLVLSGNRLNGSIPTSVGKLQNLVILDLSRNHFVGPLITEFGGLKKVYKIDLSFNNLSGAVPDTWGGLHNLLLMDLSYNNISGGIPLFLRGLSSLKDLHLSGNPLGGPLPDLWDKITGLKTLGLSDSHLVGEIPNSMCALKNLTYLALDNNNLSGAIPKEFGDLPSIFNLDLSGNKLSGLVPFSSEFMGKMGSKLQLVGNSGLCYDSGIVGQYTVRLNLSSCDEENKSSLQGNYDPMLSTVSTLETPGKILLLLFLVLSLSVVTTPVS